MLLLTGLVIGVEVVVAWRSGSLALLADAGHLVADSAGILLALAAATVAGWRSDGSRRSFGWQRVEVLAAGANAVLLLGLSGWIAWAAVRRFSNTVQVDGRWVLGAALLGLAANVVSVLVLRRGAQRSINLRGAYLEVLGDAFGSLAVIAAAVVILATGWMQADAVASLLVAALIIPRALLLLRDVADILLESAPRDMDLVDLRRHILEVEGVIDVHDLHVWTITSGMRSMSAHVVVEDTVTSAGHMQVLQRLRGCLSAHFDVDHSTFQIEQAGHRDHEQHLHH